MNDATVYRDYDQAALDAQYNNRARVLDHEDILAGYQARAEAVLEKLESRLDVSYGPSAEETLDVYLPKHAAVAPINVFLHGGYWYSRHKNDFRFLAQGLTQAGAALVCVNYALVPSVDLDELVRQCRAAVAWTHENAGTFGGDAGRIYVSGCSAGGQLTAMMMATDWPAFADGLPTDLVKGGGGGHQWHLRPGTHPPQLLAGNPRLHPRSGGKEFPPRADPRHPGAVDRRRRRRRVGRVPAPEQNLFRRLGGAGRRPGVRPDGFARPQPFHHPRPFRRCRQRPDPGGAKTDGARLTWRPLSRCISEPCRRRHRHLPLLGN